MKGSLSSIRATPDVEALSAAAREVLKTCFGFEWGRWHFKTENGILMGMSPRKRTAVRKLAAFFEEMP